MLACALGANLTACAPSSPLLRPPPAPEDCPPGAVETMEREFGITVNDTAELSLLTFNEIPRWIRVEEGHAYAMLPGGMGRLPGGSQLKGRYYFANGRVYARFTKAMIPTGAVYPACIVLTEQYDVPGAEVRAEDGSDAVQVFSSNFCMAVERFE